MDPASDDIVEGGGPEPSVSPEPENRQPESSSDWILGVLVWAAIGGWIALANKTSRAFILRWWWAILLTVAVIGVLLMITPARNWLRQRTPSYRAGLFIFGVVPLLLALVGSVTVLPGRYQITALRWVILITVCLLPATMWYLFIATRKASLLNDFLTNLDRFGLLAPSPRSTLGSATDDPAHDRRVVSYLQKFESAYGDLPDSVRNDVLANKVAPYSPSDVSAPIALSTTTVPVMLSTILIALGWLVTLPPTQVSLTVRDASTWARAFEPSATPVTLAFLGAYFFSLQMLFRRYVLRDLRGSAYVAVSMRIVLAVIGTWVVMVASLRLGLATEAQLLVVGFAIGVFPRVAWQIIQAIFKKIAHFALPSMVSDLPVSDLDGLTVWHEARLEEEDIENIPNMATADLVELLINTRFPPDRIVDWVDQAILFTQLGAKNTGCRDELRRRGVRTATSLLEASAASRKRKDRSTFDSIVCQNGMDLMPSLEATLLTNSNLELVQRWRGMWPIQPSLSIQPPAEQTSPPARRQPQLPKRALTATSTSAPQVPPDSKS
jgi:hypothetical protein